MRLIATAIAMILPQTLWAQEVLEAEIRKVTLYPQGAEVLREVEIPDGTGDIVIGGLPAGVDLAHLRVEGAGVELSGLRLVAGSGPEGAALSEARRKVAAQAEALAAREDGVRAIRAEAEAAMDQIAALRSAGGALDQGPEIGARSLALRKEAIAVEARARQADAELEADRRALHEAEADLADRVAKAANGQRIEASVTGHGRLSVTSFAEDAGWSPVYDLRLDRTARQIALTRFVSVHQASGEDWRGVDLTLSTARPDDRMDPSELWPLLRQIGPEMPVMRAAPMAEGAAMLKSDTVVPQMEGITEVYHLSQSVDIRDGVEALRLRMDGQSAPVEFWAEAVPMLDESAYLVARMTYEGADPLLPGQGVLYVDGARVGEAQVPMILPGGTMTQGFGAIDGITLARKVTRNSGDLGVISRKNALEEVTRITVENHTGFDWPLRVVDQVPYSEQDDLKIDWTAEPEISERDLDEKPGILAWKLDLPAKASREFTITTRSEWPSDQVLR